MNDIKDLTLSIKLGDIHQFMIKYEQQSAFIYKTIFNTFDEQDAINNDTINRIITLSAEIISLNMFKDYVNSDELETKRKTLNDELEQMNELKNKSENENETKLRKSGNNDGEYQRVFNILSQL